MFKAKRLIEKGVPTTSTRCPDHLSRTYSRCINMPHPYKHMHTHAHTCMHAHAHTPTHIPTHTHPHTHTPHPHTHTHTHTLSLSLSHSLTHSLILAHRDMYKKREYVRLRNFWCFMEMYVVRNSLLR